MRRRGWYVRAHALAWALLMAAAVAEGYLRIAVLAPALGETSAHLIGGGVMIVLTIVAALVARGSAPSIRWGMFAGIAWVIGTIAFEVAVTLARGLPLSDLAATYDPRRIAQGELILIGLVVMALAPIVADILARPKASLGEAT